jgi:hypothetical protein
VDINASYPLSETLTVSVAGSNVFDERRIHMLGASVIERRVLATLSWRP